LQLNVGNNPYDSYAVDIEVAGYPVAHFTPTPCQLPTFTVQQVCDYPLAFELTNTGTSLFPDIGAHYEIINVTKAQVADSGLINTLAAGATTTLQLNVGNNPYDSYSIAIEVAGYPVAHFTPMPCQLPTFTVQQVCGYPLAFEVTNTGSDALLPVVGAHYEIINVTKAQSAISGLIDTLAAGATTTLYLNVGDNPYDSYSIHLEVAGYPVAHVTPTPCQVPTFTVQQVCGYPLAFEVTNTGSAALFSAVGADYEIINVTQSQVVNSGNIDTLAAGGTVTLYLNAGDDPFDSYSIVIEVAGYLAAHVTPTPCPTQMLWVTVGATCGAPISFDIINASGSALSNATYAIHNDTENADAQTGQFTLAFLDSMTLTLNGVYDPYDTYSLIVNDGVNPEFSFQRPACERPVLQVQSQCAYPLVFTVTNTGGDFLIPQDYAITTGGNSVDAGQLNLLKGASATFTLTGQNPYLPYVFQSDGAYIPVTPYTQSCTPPVVEIQGYCTTPSFSVINSGGDMLLDHPLVTTWNGQMISLPVTTLHMAANDIVWVSAVGYDLTIPMTLSTNTFNINGAFTLQCLPPAAFPTNTPIPATTPTPAASQSGGGVIDGTTPSVSGQVCGYNCPAFSLYHSDEAGRWEIFRLNGANGQTTLRQNLSFGSEQNADALAPSLSPNSQWIAFASNRDGNWEIYIASTDGDAHSLRRLTINAVAVDTDPVWGPNNMVVFETTRNGNWDLYAADMANGRVFPLVNAPDGDDVNAAWSPDGRRLLFQSDRPDTNGVRKWQIYELNLTTMAITRLSDGSTIDVDPQYSPDGSSIVFRSYTSEGAVSLINLMDVNGANRRVITGEDQDSTNPVWSPQNHYIAYQAVKNGQLDLFLYDVAAGITRQLTDSDVPDYAPSWLCTEDSLLFTSEASGNPDIYEIAVQPISAPPVDVLQGATRLTFGSANDVYPLSFPSEENASREGASGSALLSQQTTFVPLSLSLTAPEISLDGEGRAGWESLDVCTP
ncbi:MAG: PD40 domain-containing protein, partial [Anaerolinea sp.]|nr:PD40 domain-containing protein [Anaerolinea sp.]